MFRFTIRDVLWLTVVVAVGCGWWLEHRRAEYRESKEVDELTRSNQLLFNDANEAMSDRAILVGEIRELREKVAELRGKLGSPGDQN
jgi:hypothetical protein